MTEKAMAWAAGLFDGEGCISISAVKPNDRNQLVNNSYRLTVKVTMGCRETVEHFGQIVQAGTFHIHRKKGARINASYSWVAMARKGEDVLRRLAPYLVTKKKETEVALEFCSLPDVARGGRKGSPVIEERLLKKKHDLYVACARLKPRFRFRRNQLIKHQHWITREK